MNYNILYADFNSLFPECTEKLNSLARAADAEETDGMHIMFSFVVIPFILDLLNNDEAKQYMGTNMIECCKRAEQFLQVGE